MEPSSSPEAVARQSMDVDIACVGFGPATAGFLTTLSRRLAAVEKPALESRGRRRGCRSQVVCYERADDVGFGVSGVVTRGRGHPRGLPRPRPGADPHGRAGEGGEGPLPPRPASAPAAARPRCAPPTRP